MNLPRRKCGSCIAGLALLLLTFAGTGHAGPQTRTETLAHRRILKRDSGIVQGRQSLPASGHFVNFAGPQGEWYLVAVQVYASRFGGADATAEEWRITLCDADFKPLFHIDKPWAVFERGRERWYEIDVPPLALPEGERFWLNLAFNPHETRGIKVGYDIADLESFSRTGLPGGPVKGMPRKTDWMIRAVISSRPARAADEPAGWRRAARCAPGDLGALVELKYDDGAAEGWRRFVEGGPAVRFVNVPRSAVLERLRIYASRYGSGYDPAAVNVDYLVLGEDGSTLASGSFPYEAIDRDGRWAEVRVGPVKVPAEFRVVLASHSDAAKGVYFHYDASGEGANSKVALAGGEIVETEVPLTWMIRAYLRRDCGEPAE